MRPELKPLLWAGGATLVAVLLIGYARTRTTTAAPAAITPAPVIASIDPINTQPHPARASDAGPLPWQRAPDHGASTRHAGDSTRPAAAQASMDRAQIMATMQVQLQRNQIATDAALQRIDELQASGQAPQDLDLDALRGNLQIARRAQSLAMELARSSGEPDTPERARKIADITAQLQALQAQLQPAAIGQGATAAALAPRTP